MSKQKTLADEFKIQFVKPKNWECTDGHVVEHKPYKKYLRTDIKDIFE